MGRHNLSKNLSLDHLLELKGSSKRASSNLSPKMNHFPSRMSRQKRGVSLLACTKGEREKSRDRGL